MTCRLRRLVCCKPLNSLVLGVRDGWLGLARLTLTILNMLTCMQAGDDYRYYAAYEEDVDMPEAPVSICGRKIDAIVDSGASHTMMSEFLTRQLQLYKHMKSNRAKFHTSARKLERPVGKLVDVPITVGSLTLLVDVYVS